MKNLENTFVIEQGIYQNQDMVEHLSYNNKNFYHASRDFVLSQGVPVEVFEAALAAQSTHA